MTDLSKYQTGLCIHCGCQLTMKAAFICEQCFRQSVNVRAAAAKAVVNYGEALERLADHPLEG